MKQMTIFIQSALGSCMVTCEKWMAHSCNYRYRNKGEINGVTYSLAGRAVLKFRFCCSSHCLSCTSHRMLGDTRTEGQTPRRRSVSVSLCVLRSCAYGEWQKQAIRAHSYLLFIYLSDFSCDTFTETDFLSVPGDYSIIIFDRFLLIGSSPSSLIPFGITDLLLTLETLLTWRTSG